MNDRKPRRFYWFEGVTRDEIERGLNDTRPSALRRQAPRRQLVVATAFMTAALAVQPEGMATTLLCICNCVWPMAASASRTQALVMRF